MKRIDKAKELHTNMRETEIVYKNCPEDLIRCEPTPCPVTFDNNPCYVCWEKEVEEQ